MAQVLAHRRIPSLLQSGSDTAVGPVVSPAASPRDDGLDAAGATVETTTLNMSVVDATYHIYCLVVLVEGHGFKSVIAMTWGYDGGNRSGPSRRR